MPGQRNKKQTHLVTQPKWILEPFLCNMCERKWIFNKNIKPELCYMPTKTKESSRKPMNMQKSFPKSHWDAQSGYNLDGFELACVYGHPPTTLKGQAKDDTGIVISCKCQCFLEDFTVLLLPLRSRLRAPLECWVTVRESILSVCTLLASRDTTTLCHWLSLSCLSELPFISDGPLPRSKT